MTEAGPLARPTRLCSRCRKQLHSDEHPYCGECLAYYQDRGEPATAADPDRATTAARMSDPKTDAFDAWWKTHHGQHPAIYLLRGDDNHESGEMYVAMCAAYAAGFDDGSLQMASNRPLIEAEARAAERQRIRELHKRVDRGRVQPCCEGCELECDRCHEWPCPTIRLLDGDDDE